MPMLMGPPNRACYKHTCRIQECLSENNYNERACAWAIDALKRCCEMPHAKYSIHCGFPDLNRQEPEQAKQQAEEAESRGDAPQQQQQQQQQEGQNEGSKGNEVNEKELLPER